MKQIILTLVLISCADLNALSPKDKFIGLLYEPVICNWKKPSTLLEAINSLNITITKKFLSKGDSLSKEEIYDVQQFLYQASKNTKVAEQIAIALFKTGNLIPTCGSDIDHMLDLKLLYKEQQLLDCRHINQILNLTTHKVIVINRVITPVKLCEHYYRELPIAKYIDVKLDENVAEVNLTALVRAVNYFVKAIKIYSEERIRKSPESKKAFMIALLRKISNKENRVFFCKRFKYSLIDL